MSRVFVGSFNAEFFWQDENTCILPSIRDNESIRIISAMDELQLLLCQSNRDTIFTRYKIDTCLQEYHKSIGIEYINSSIEETAKASFTEAKEVCIFDLIVRYELTSNFLKYKEICPYSISEKLDDLCAIIKIENSFPSSQITSNVNSKKYSHFINEEILGLTKSFLISSSEDLNIFGKKMLANSQIVVKELFGVSGKGSLIIDSESKLLRLAKYLTKQEKTGKRVELILEPFLSKKIDFSSQLLINETGEISFLSVNEMDNDGFNFNGMKEATENTLIQLNKSDYFPNIEKVAKKLYSDGYFGPVCIDSMILTSNEIIPLVEINARKSMGFIFHFLKKKFTLVNSKFVIRFMFYSFIAQEEITAYKIIESLHKKGILFTSNNSEGIIPLSSATLNINYGNSHNNKYKGRFYFSVLSKDKIKEAILLNNLYKSFKESNIMLLNKF